MADLYDVGKRRPSIRRRFLEDAATHYRPEVEAMRAAIEELSADDHFWKTMERVAMHTAWRIRKERPRRNRRVRPVRAQRVYAG